MAKLRFLNQPYTLKNLTLRNRVVMPPMCQYAAQDGMPNDWHKVHYTARAIGGVGLIIVEMTNVAPNGRISPNCLGLWNDEQRDVFKEIVASVHQYGLRDRAQKNGPEVQYSPRQLLGFTDADIETISDLTLAHLAT